MLSFRMWQTNCLFVLTMYYNVITIKMEYGYVEEKNMAVLQVRIDDELKWQSNEILEEIGIDMSTAIRMFLKKVIMTRGIPFDATIDEQSLRFRIAMRKAQEISKENGNCNMTLDEINEEIRLAREERKRKEK